MVEGVVNGGVHAEEALGGASRFEALHLALSSTHDLMGILRSVVRPQAAFVMTAETEMLEGRGVGSRLVGDDQRRLEAVALQQLAHQLHGRVPVAPALDQHVEDLAFVVDGSPEVHLLAADPDDHLVEMPLRARGR